MKRVGAKNNPVFRIVVADGRSPRDGKFIEELGTYQPLKKGDNVTFDVERASVSSGTPELPSLLRSGRPADVPMLRSIGLRLLGVAAPTGIPDDLPSLAVLARDGYPLASRLLEAVLAGETRIDYTSLTLPPA